MPLPTNSVLVEVVTVIVSVEGSIEEWSNPNTVLAVRQAFANRSGVPLELVSLTVGAPMRLRRLQGVVSLQVEIKADANHASSIVDDLSTNLAEADEMASMIQAAVPDMTVEVSSVAPVESETVVLDLLSSTTTTPIPANAQASTSSSAPSSTPSSPSASPSSTPSSSPSSAPSSALPVRSKLSPEPSLTAGSLPVGSKRRSHESALDLAQRHPLLVAERGAQRGPYQHPQLCPVLGALPFGQSCHRDSVTIGVFP